MFKPSDASALLTLMRRLVTLDEVMFVPEFSRATSICETVAVGASERIAAKAPVT